MASNWAKPTDLDFPLTARGLEDINSMFEKLFSKLPLDVSHGGTGLSFGDVAIGDVLYGDEDSAGNAILSTATSVPAGSYFRSGGLVTAPVWSTVTIPNTAVTGDLWYGSATDTITALGIGTVGKIIRSSGTLPVYSTFTIPDTYAQGDVLYASATNVLTALAKDATATRYLSNKGASNIPSWSQVTLTNGVTGALPVGNGGTGLTSIGEGAIIQGNAGVFIATTLGSAGAYLRAASGIAIWSTLLLPNAAAQGDTFIATATNTMTVLAKNTTATRYLSNTGASNNPAWAQVVLTDGVSGTLPVANGGTGVTSSTGTVAVVLSTSPTLVTPLLGIPTSGTLTNCTGLPLATGVTGDLPFASFVQASGASVLVGRGSAAGAGDFQEITLGANMTMTGTVLASTGGASPNALLDGSVHSDTVAQTVTRGSLVYGNATPKWDELGIGAAARLLRSDGTDAAWAQAVLTTDVTGTLPVANGGTGIATLTASRIPYGNGTSAFQSAADFLFDGTTFTTAGQIAFPATQAASTNANTLDDYEEGTWTPVIGGATSESGQTYAGQTGNYIKVGKYVFITCDVALSAKGTITGDVVIKGLPFSGAAFNQPNTFSRWLNTVTSFTGLVFNTDGAIAEIYVITAATTSVGTGMVTGDIGDSTRFIFVASYIATA